MSVFGNYSRYYDLIYRDKDYVKETQFVLDMLTPCIGQSASLLELGCGTGKHATLLAEKGYSIHGVDQSEEMLVRARDRLAELPMNTAQRLCFAAGDARTYRTEKKVDAVISLFHVASYQTTNDDLLDYMQTASAHLKPGGVFLFDYWYGPAVLSDRPARREKHMESGEIEVQRIATPTMDATASVVDVRYDISIRDKQSNVTETLQETHRMRYLFTPEIDLLARISGLRVVRSTEWLTGATPSYQSWNVCSLLTK